MPKGSTHCPESSYRYNRGYLRLMLRGDAAKRGEGCCGSVPGPLRSPRCLDAHATYRATAGWIHRHILRV